LFHDCETWFLILRVECRLRIFENRLLRRIFGPKKGEVTDKWRRLHKKELYALCSTPDIIRVIKYKRLRCSTYGQRRGTYRVLVGKPRKGGHLEKLGVDGRIILK
jgi:hypothetical protein